MRTYVPIALAFVGLLVLAFCLAVGGFLVRPRWFAIHAPSFAIRFRAASALDDADPEDDAAREMFLQRLGIDDIRQHRDYLFQRMRDADTRARLVSIRAVERWLALDGSASLAADELAAIADCLRDDAIWSEAFHLAVEQSGSREDDLGLILAGLISPVQDCRMTSIGYARAHARDPKSPALEAAIAESRRRYGADAFRGADASGEPPLPASVRKVP